MGINSEDIDDDVESSCVHIDEKSVNYCNKLCHLDTTELVKNDTDNSSVKITVTSVQDGIITNPYISVAPIFNYNIKYNNVTYTLDNIYIWGKGGTIHNPGEINKNLKNNDNTREILMHFKSSNENSIMLSVLVESTKTISRGSEFFSIIFDGLLSTQTESLDSQITIKTQDDKTAGLLYTVTPDSNWGPNMLIPDDKSFYKYNSKIPKSLIDGPTYTTTWLIFKETTTLTTLTDKVINRLLTIGMSTSSTKAPPLYINATTNSLNEPIYPVYMYKDKKYRDPLDKNDIVIKCDKVGECDEGDIEGSNQSTIEMNNKLNGCPLTLSGKELGSIAHDSILPSFQLSKVFTKCVMIALNLFSILGAYYFANKIMSVYSSPFNPMQWFTLIGVLVWKLLKIIHPATLGVRKDQLAQMPGKIREKVESGWRETAEQARSGAKTKGGNLIDGHTRFANHYKNHLIH